MGILRCVTRLEQSFVLPFAHTYAQWHTDTHILIEKHRNIEIYILNDTYGRMTAVQLAICKYIYTTDMRTDTQTNTKFLLANRI